MTWTTADADDFRNYVREDQVAIVTEDKGALVAIAGDESARLIAAAPAMLAALRVVEAYLAGLDEDGQEATSADLDHLASIRAAIAAAEGRTHD